MKPQPQPLTLDVDAISLKLSAATGILDLVYTLDTTGDLGSLCDHSLHVAIDAAMTLIGEARQLLAGTSQGEAA